VSDGINSCWVLLTSGGEQQTLLRNKHFLVD
jgi:hypothetical protein